MLQKRVVGEAKKESLEVYIHVRSNRNKQSVCY